MTDTHKRKPGRPRKVAPATQTDQQPIACNQVTGREVTAETVRNADLAEISQLRAREGLEDAREIAKAKVLAAISMGLSATAGALHAGVLRGAYKWRTGDPEFAAAWEKAYQAGTDVFEDEARRRAVEGVERPVFQAGEEDIASGENDRLMVLMPPGRRNRLTFPTCFRPGSWRGRQIRA